MFHVACVGILVADAIAKTVDKIPGRGKLGLIDSLKLYSGGCAMNASIDMSKMGASVALLGKIGNDGFGDFLKGELEKYNVNIDGLLVDENTSTSASVVLVDSGGERTFIHSTGANGTFAEKDINYEIIAQSKIVFVAGSMLMPDFDGEGCAAMLKKAKDMDKTTVLDTAWDDKGRWMNVLGPCMPYIDYFIPSIEEAQQLSGETKPDKIANVFFEKGVRHVVIKLGEKGCYIKPSADGEEIYLPSYNNIKVVDTTGAGDSFCAGFLYGIAHDMSIIESCRLANAVGAHCVMCVGATTGIKSYDEIKTFIKENM